MKLAIAMTTTGTIKSQTVFCMLRMIKQLKCDYAVFIKDGSILHYNREQLVKSAYDTGCTHILFIDSDMYFEPDAANKLIARNKDIVGVHYNLRKNPPTTTVHMDKIKKSRIKEDHPDGFLTCDAVATGFLLINMDVFKKVKEPWFFWKTDKDGEVVMGEDYWFCEKARKVGYDIWVDLTIPVKHIGDYLY